MANINNEVCSMYKGYEKEFLTLLNDNKIIQIDGASGTGKTTLAVGLANSVFNANKNSVMFMTNCREGMMYDGIISDVQVKSYDKKRGKTSRGDIGDILFGDIGLKCSMRILILDDVDTAGVRNMLGNAYGRYTDDIRIIMTTTADYLSKDKDISEYSSVPHIYLAPDFSLEEVSLALTHRERKFIHGNVHEIVDKIVEFNSYLNRNPKYRKYMIGPGHVISGSEFKANIKYKVLPIMRRCNEEIHLELNAVKLIGEIEDLLVKCV